MILDTLGNIRRYLGLSNGLDTVIRAIEKGAYRSAADGRHTLDGADAYYLVQSPAYAREGQWERHERTIDLQLSLTGDERCGYLPANEVTRWGEYNAEKDICLAPGTDQGVTLPLRKGWFVIFFPQDAHMPCLAACDAPEGRKVVFKARL